MFAKIKALAGRIRPAKRAQKILALQLVLALFTGAIVVTLNESAKIFKIKDGDEITHIRTVQSDPYEILDLAGVTVAKEDEVVVSGDEIKTIEINRAFPVTVTVEGEAKVVKMLPYQTVADALQLCGVTASDELVITPAPATAVKESIEVTVVKPEPVLKEEVQPVLAEQKTEIKAEPEKKEQTPAKPEQPEQPAAAPTANSGTNVISTLTPDSPIELDSTGRPVKYVKKLTGRATAYCYGTTCATGVKVRPGYIAVNPKQIPYGTKMYIVSADGKYHYGYSIAADTGGFAKKGTAIADLYMSSYEQCIQFGRRNIEIYILE